MILSLKASFSMVLNHQFQFILSNVFHPKKTAPLFQLVWSNWNLFLPLCLNAFLCSTYYLKSSLLFILLWSAIAAYDLVIRRNFVVVILGAVIAVDLIIQFSIALLLMPLTLFVSFANSPTCSCQEWLAQSEIKKIMACENISYQDALVFKKNKYYTSVFNYSDIVNIQPPPLPNVKSNPLP